MKNHALYKEAARLYKLGFAIHWLHPKSKRPIESGWTTGPRKKWDYLKETYIDGLNLGVRLGTPSKIKNGFLAVVDVDVKSKDKRHRNEAVAAAKQMLDGVSCPEVRSGRGNGSRHYYCLTRESFKTFNPAQSKEIVKVFMPSKKASKKEIETLTQKEIKEGIRLAPAWEISLYSDGRQVVLPPSIHPDSGEPYQWVRHLNLIDDLSLIAFNLPQGEENGAIQNPSKPSSNNSRGIPNTEDAAFKFEAQDVDLNWLPITDSVREGIIQGRGVQDRSGYLLTASSALISAGLTQNEVLSVLTDPSTFLGAVGYDHAKTKDRARAAHWVYKYTFKDVAQARSATHAFSKAPPIGRAQALTDTEIEEQNKEFGELRHWTQDLERTVNGVLKSTIVNVVLILTNEIGKDFLKRDDFAFRDSYSCDTPWGGKKDSIVTDDDVANIKFWLGQNYAFEPKKEVIYDALTVTACQNTFDPIKQMLEALPPWDGRERLNTWLADNFEAQGDPEYLAQVFRKWMFAMVMRVYRPGSKFDWMPIFEGAQGIGKSSFGRLLVGDKHFLDWLPNLNDKDSALSLQGMWGVEMGELSQFRKNELENIKAFISRTVDKLRPPYGRRLQEHARRCVFFGTTNRATYLTDDTGNRRFKPLIVGNLNFLALARDRNQLFAEAKYLFDNKMESELTLELAGKAKIYEHKIHGEKMVEDDSNLMIEAMSDFIEKVQKGEAHFDFKKFKIWDLFDGGRGVGGPLVKWTANNRNSQFAAKMIKKLGGYMKPYNGRNFWYLDHLVEKTPKVEGWGEEPPTMDFM